MNSEDRKKFIEKLDKEEILLREWIRRIEEEVKQHSQEIARVKLQLKIA